MKSAGNPHRPSYGKIISFAVIAIGVATGVFVEQRSSIRPSTDDATIDADVVHVASAVGGRIIELPVTENAKVSKGDLLLRIDPEPYRLAVEQAEAELGVVVGALDTRRRTIATDKSNATIASEQIKRAQTNLELATRTVERLRPLVAKAYVPTQQFDQAQTAQRDAATSLQQAREQVPYREHVPDCIGGRKRHRRRANQACVDQANCEKNTRQKARVRRFSGRFGAQSLVGVFESPEFLLRHACR